MAKSRKRWVWVPPKPPKAAVPDSLKTELSIKAQELVEKHLKPTYIKPAPKNTQFNYVVDISTKWYRNYFYFCSTYACPGPNALSPTFEYRFARMEYAGMRKFHLAYMRHTGQWWQLYAGLTLDECLTAIRDEPHFFP